MSPISAEGLRQTERPPGGAALLLMAGKRAGASDFLLKPFDRKILTAVFGNRAIAA